jgi:hypothetical protein
MTTTSKAAAICVILLISAPALPHYRPQDRAGRPSNSADVSRTVAAFAGKWSGQMTATIPGAPSETFDWTMDCKPVAMGSGVSCTNGGKASIGVMAESCLLAYDPEGKAVHYMCVTSMGEVHDHKGQWKNGSTIEFEPLIAGMIGQTVTETLNWRLPNPKTLSKTSTVTTPDGNKMTFVFTGKRD